MFKLFKKQIDPALNMSADNVDYNVVLHPGNDIYNFIEYNNMYFSKDSFVAKAYVSNNGVILIVPTISENLEEDKEEQKRLVVSLKEIKELLMLHIRVIPIFMTTDTFYFGKPVGEHLTQMTRIPDISLFINNLLYGVGERHLELDEITDEYYTEDLTVDAYYMQEHSEDEEGYCCHMAALDDKTLKHVDLICSKYEDNIRPTDKYRVDEDGQEWICRDKAVSIKGFDTGLVNGKEWYKVTQDFNTEQVSRITMFLGWTGIHWFYLGKKLKAIAYLLSCGCFGILPFVDLLQMAMGTFTYEDIDYDSEPVVKKRGTKVILVRRSEKIYFKKPIHWYKTALMSIGCLAISLLIGCTLYVTIYRSLGLVSENVSLSVVDLIQDSEMVKYFIR